jgi:inorganic phosphate transporter, PiT family
MGLIALTLWTATQKNLFTDLPPWLAFLYTPEFEIAFWIKAACSITMALGTAAGGWRIIRTLGHRLVKLQRIHGFAVQTTAATVIQVASHWGIPLSTTHVISASIMGVGATRRLNAVKWTVVGQMVWAWVLTLPIAALLGYLLERMLP